MFTIALFADGIFPLQTGGMQKHSFYLTKFLARKKIKTDLYYLTDSTSSLNTTLEKEFSSQEKEFINLFPVQPANKRFFPGHYIFENYIASKKLYKSYCKNPAVDFIYAQGFTGWYTLRKKNRNVTKETSLGINFHGLNMFQTPPSKFSILSYYSFKFFVLQNLKKADHIFSLGGKLTTILQNSGFQQKVIEIPIGIAENWLSTSPTPNKSQKISFIFIGRYDRLKGIEELSDVIYTNSNNAFSSSEFHFIGPIPANKQIKDLPNVKYYGAINDENRIKEILRNCDVLICPSWSEGMPTVILEAMASGCAIIATDVGAVSEQVDASNGILIEPGNKPELKAAIERMIALPAEQLLEMKKASIKRVEEKFLWDKVAELTIAEIKKIIENRP
jgi:glycosyltransferase involved in cell wall biosynthesis